MNTQRSSRTLLYFESHIYIGSVVTSHLQVESRVESLKGRVTSRVISVSDRVESAASLESSHWFKSSHWFNKTQNNRHSENCKHFNSLRFDRCLRVQSLITSLN
jgi:hypothetical protein